MNKLNGQSRSCRRLRGGISGLLALGGCLILGPTAGLAAVKDGQKYQDWTGKCEQLPDNKGEQCFIFQTLTDEEAKRPVLQTVVGYLQDGKPALIFTVPLGVALRAGLGLKIDDGEVSRIPYENCNPVGCVAGVPLENKLISSLKRGLKATVVVFDGSGRRISLELSLKGFTSGFDALTPSPASDSASSTNPTSNDSDNP